MGCEHSNMHNGTRISNEDGLAERKTSYLQRNSILAVFDSSRSSSKSSFTGESGILEKKKLSSDRGSADMNGSRQNSILQRTFATRRTIEDLSKVIELRINLFDYFTEFEKDVLLSTWSVLGSESHKHGAFIFHLAAEMFPGLREIFNISENIEECSDSDNEHIIAYMKLISDAIQSLECPDDNFFDVLIIAGARHATLPNMKMEYFKIFKRATLVTWDSLLGEEYSDDVKQVWHSLLDYIITVMSEGCLIFEHEEEQAILAASLTRNSQLPESTIRQLQSRPSVASMSPEEWAKFHAICR